MKPGLLEREKAPAGVSSEPEAPATPKRAKHPFPYVRWMILGAVLAAAVYFAWLRITALPEVEIGSASVSKIWSSFTAEGVVRGTDYKLSGQTGGRVVAIYAREGDTVRAGQLLVRLESTQADAAVQEATASYQLSKQLHAQTVEESALISKRFEASLAAAHARLRQAELAHAEILSGARPLEIEQANQRIAKANAAVVDAQRSFTRAEALFNAGAVARANLEKAEAALKAAQADLKEAEAAAALLRSGPSNERMAVSQSQIESAKAGVRLAESESRQLDVMRKAVAAASARTEQARAGLARTLSARNEQTIRAPAQGYVTKLEVEPGAVLLPGMAALTIASRSDLRIEAEISSEDASKVNVGMEVSVTSPAFPGRRFRAKVRNVMASGELKPDAAIRTRIVRARIALLESPELFRPGMEVDVEGSSLLKKTLTVPTDALRFEGEHASVFVFENGRTIERKVTIGIQNPEMTEIMAGLRPGEKVITRGKDIVEPGQRVQVNSP